MGSVFGGRGSSGFLTKVTSVLAALFLFIALIMGMITQGKIDEASLIERERDRRISSPARTLPQIEAPAQEGTTSEQPPPTPSEQE